MNSLLPALSLLCYTIVSLRIRWHKRKLQRGPQINVQLPNATSEEQTTQCFAMANLANKSTLASLGVLVMFAYILMHMLQFNGIFVSRLWDWCWLWSLYSLVWLWISSLQRKSCLIPKVSFNNKWNTFKPCIHWIFTGTFLVYWHQSYASVYMWVFMAISYYKNADLRTSIVAY